MAGRIKGITVEIGGDTTGLEKALKSVNTTIRNTQSQLKDVNRLLKLDPSNTELLSQKQRALKEAIGATKEKLDSLKTAQEQAKQQLENGDLGQDKYDALQREIIETEQELRRLQEEAASTSVALAKIDEAGKKIEAFGDSVTNAGQAIMPASMAVAGLGAAAVKTAADFDTSMSKVAAVSGATGDDLDALRDKAREMGAKTKFSASEAADAMNYMAMAGWKTGDMLEGIEGIMNLAAASGEDLATTSDIVTDALTAFGLSAQDSAHFADILAAASSNANTNVSMMGETFKYCAPIAGALGFSAEDTAEAIGLMANAGIKGSQAGTALRTIMNNLTGEIKLSGKALGDVTIATTNADGSMRDLSDILADCRGAFSQLSESEQAAAAEALVGKNAMSGFLALMNAGDADIEKLASSIDHCSDTFVKTVDGAIIPMSQALEEGIDWIEEYNGVSEQMAAVMQDNLGGQLTILKSQIQELAISFGEMLMPAIRAIVSKIQAFVDKLNNMSESQRKAILTIGLIVAALGPFLVIIGTLISKVGAAMQGFVKLATGVKKLCVAVKAGTGVFGKLGAALGGISAPVLAIVAVIAVLIAAFKHLWDTNEEFRNAITAIWEGIVSKISAFCQGIVDRLNALGFDFGSIVDVLKSLWDGLCQFLAPVFEAAFNAVSTVLGTVLDVITGLLDVFIGLFTGNWSQMWEGVKEIFSGIWDGITGLFDTALNLLKSLAETVFGWFGTTWESVWTGIKSFFETIWNGIVAFFSGIWNAIVSTVTAQINAVKTVVTTVFNAIKTTATTIWNGIKTAISTVVDGIKSKVSSVFESVKSTATNLFNGIKSTATNVWNGIKTAIITPIEAARDKIRSALDAVRGFFSGLKLELPHIKLPHFRVSGTLSISPPSVPHLSIDWYKEGGIMTKPTVFGMNGSALMAGGESGSEAILPLSGFYKQLEAMLTEKLNMHNVEKYLAVIAANSGKGIYLDDGTLVGRLLPAIDSGLGQTQKLNARLSL
ncbi:MAG: phage tail tape measure protein [Oscillospiraceae bacterium]|nr:phage tail tape measure protein [Oscillospiraceae bacterium]